MVRIDLLGGVNAATDAGEPLDVGPAKRRAVLAALALSAGEAVPVSRLVDVVWGAEPPPSAAKTLQGYVADLRKDLGSDVIVRIGAAYRLEVAADAVDVSRFRRYLTAGEVDAALAEWTGEPLAGLEAPGLGPVTDGLVEQWLGAVETDIERRVSVDAPATVATLTQLTADYPFREGLWALLMTALYRSGRQADALAAYQRARRHLVEELGVEPGPRLREVERSILEHDTRLGADATPSMDARLGNLPARLGRLFGRDGDVDHVVAALAASPVVTLVGPGGIGKTSLALAAAHRRQDADPQRVWLVELAEIAASADVPRAVADTLGVVEGSQGTLTESLVAVLQAHRTLLVLDNCEHVIDGAAALAGTVSRHAVHTRVLATSRESLGIAGEQVVNVGPLDPAGAAVELFVTRARSVFGDFDVDGGRSEIAELCRRLDGVPLAIELAATRSRSLTPSQLLARLGDRLRLLTGGSRAGADRHRTLRAAIEWSYELLSPAQRLLFQRLSVFTGPFDLAAAESVTACDDLDNVDVVELLGDLVERSMVTAELVPDLGARPFGRRFRLLETLRHFAAEQLAAHGEPGTLARRHAGWCRDEVRRVHGLLTGWGEAEGVARLEELWPNLRTALDWACGTADAALADALVRPVAVEVNLRRQAEISDWAQRILELMPRDDESAIVFWLVWATDRMVQGGDHEAYERFVARYGHTEHPVVRYTHAYLYDDGEDGYESSRAALSWLRERGEDHAANLVEVAGVASPLMGLRRFAELDTLAATMEQRYRVDGPPTLLYFALGLRGYAAQFQGRHDDAARFFAESAGIGVPAGTFLINRTVEARTLFEQGQRSRALRMLREHVDDLLDTDYVDVARMVAMEFVYMVAALGRLTEAARVLTYLDTTGSFGVLARNTLLADAVNRIAAEAGVTGDGQQFDARQALTYMRGVLDDLAEDPRTVS